MNPNDPQNFVYQSANHRRYPIQISGGRDLRWPDGRYAYADELKEGMSFEIDDDGVISHVRISVKLPTQTAFQAKTPSQAQERPQEA